MSRRPVRRYVPPKHYTEAELLVAQFADLYTDLRCAKRDGDLRYAETVLGQIDALVAKHPVEAALGAAMAAAWADEVAP